MFKNFLFIVQKSFLGVYKYVSCYYWDIYIRVIASPN